MDNIDALIYTKKFIEELDKEGLFNEEDPFLDREILYKEILKVATSNVLELGEPTLEFEQFDEALMSTRKTAIAETFDDLINDGMLQMSGLNKDGEFLYSLSEPPDSISLLKNKKNKKK